MGAVPVDQDPQHGELLVDFLWSPFAHARVRSLDVTEAKKAAWDWAMQSWGPVLVDPPEPPTDRLPDVSWHTRTITWGNGSLQQLQDELEERNAEGRRIELRWRFVDGS